MAVEPKPCSAKGCGANAYRRGMCGPHYMNFLATKNESEGPILCKECGREGAGKLVRLCNTCQSRRYHQQRKSDPEYLQRKRETQKRYRQANKEVVAERKRNANRRKQVLVEAYECEAMIKKLVTREFETTAIQWGPKWEDMISAAKELGSRGMMFEIKQTSKDDLAKGIERLPELILHDSRFRPVVVTPGLWIIVHPGERNFRVLSSEQMSTEYKEAA
jgi:hypothetical protein